MTREKLIDAIETVAEALKNKYGHTPDSVKIYHDGSGLILCRDCVREVCTKSSGLADALLPPPPPNPCAGKTLAELPRGAPYVRWIDDEMRLLVRIDEGGQLCRIREGDHNGCWSDAGVCQKDLVATDWQPYAYEGGDA